MPDYTKTDAIVLKTVNYSETSQVLTFCSEQFGKLRAIAKGARRGKKAGGAGMDLLNLCEIVVIYKQPPTLSLVTTWQVTENFSALRSDLDRLYTSLYAAELVSKTIEEGNPEQDVFKLLASFLRALSRGTECYPAVLRFEFLLLERLGLAPELSGCVSCGAKIENGAAFSAEAGGLLCGNCAPQTGGSMVIPKEGIEAMRKLASEAGPGRSEISHSIFRPLRSALDAWLAYHTGFIPDIRKHIDPPGTDSQAQ